MAQASDKPSHNIVVVGGSFGGLPVTHTLLKDTIPTLGSTKAYKVYLISPNSEFYWKPSAPRVIVNSALLGEEKAFHVIAQGFKQYDKSKFEHIQAFATSIDPAANTISYGQNPDTTSFSIPYHTLVLASGSSFRNPAWSVQSGEKVTKEALKDMREQIPAAEHIVIIGGGPVGTETAGEFGYLYGSSKEVTLLSGQQQLLHRLDDKRIGQDAEGRLKKQGIKVVHNIRCKNTEEAVNGITKTLQLSDGSEMPADLVIDATGDTPNNRFVPKAWLTEQGLVKTSVPTLRLDVPSVKNVYAIGSISSALKGNILGIAGSYKPLCESIRVDLADEDDGPKRKKINKPLTKDAYLVPIGPKQGVGTAYGWKLPSFLITMFKGKDFMVRYAPSYIDGTGP